LFYFSLLSGFCKVSAGCLLKSRREEPGGDFLKVAATDNDGQRDAFALSRVIAMGFSCYY
jgi:hypothetical protein